MQTTTLTNEFDTTFEDLLTASNLVHRLRVIEADFTSRSAAVTNLFYRRVDMAEVRSHLS